jgi:Mg2+-importing ATPase
MTPFGEENALSTVVSAAAGLTAAEARRRRAAVGPNEPARRRRGAALAEVLGFLANPLVVILLVASVVSAIVGDTINAVIIVVMVALSVVLNFVQMYRSRGAAERLRDEVGPRASVRRDGAWVEIARRDVVPGDVIRLSAGDRVPADARLLETRDLHIQEAALTGESLPVEKHAGAQSMVFLGTSVVSGTAVAEVVATGPATAFGDIAARLMERPPETEFERGIRRFAVLIMRTVVFLVLFVLLAGALLHRPGLETLLFAVALAVGLTPEFLPMITTVTLAKGAVRMARQQVIVRHLAAIEDFGSMDVLCSDKTGTLTTGEVEVTGRLDPFGQPAERPLALAYLNSFYETGIRSPLDEAILRTGGSAGDYRKIDEIPFDFERRRLSVVVAAGDEVVLITKGAPEPILERCIAYEMDGGERRIDAGTSARCRQTYEALGHRGARVLAVARRRLPPQPAYSADDERELVLVGFVAFSDPLVPGVADALAALRRDGVTVKIVTGDSELVARHVAEQVGFDTERLVLGADIEGMTDSALGVVAERTDVFARVSPAQKNRIILALKARDHVVGFLGDGINDAPSLHAADVGISVANAVDVAKDAADIILQRRNLDVLHTGILEGRKAFANVMKYLLMGTSSNFGNMFSMAGAILFLPFLPMLPIQILLNNLLYDLAQVTIPTDRVDPEFVQAPQRWRIDTIRNFMFVIGPISSVYDFLTFFTLLTVFAAPAALFHTGWFVESLATQTLVLFVIRTARSPLRSRPSAWLTATTLLVVVVGCLLPFTPLASALGFVPLPPAYFVFLVAATATYLVLVEAVKRRLIGRLTGGKEGGGIGFDA